ncbi:MAG: hypothetical protein M1840_007008 [Geoglossum simile]|nr:MAG: hypothetical protein M1840_007008 [Geoglossum simile]
MATPDWIYSPNPCRHHSLQTGYFLEEARRPGFKPGVGGYASYPVVDLFNAIVIGSFNWSTEPQMVLGFFLERHRIFWRIRHNTFPPNHFDVWVAVGQSARPIDIARQEEPIGLYSRERQEVNGGAHILVLDLRVIFGTELATYMLAGEKGPRLFSIDNYPILNSGPRGQGMVPLLEYKPHGPIWVPTPTTDCVGAWPDENPSKTGDVVEQAGGVRKGDLRHRAQLRSSDLSPPLFGPARSTYQLER